MADVEWKGNTLNGELEAMIDAVGMSQLLSSISQVCNLKADHIRQNWQDRALAKLWERDGNRIANVIPKLVVP